MFRVILFATLFCLPANALFSQHKTERQLAQLERQRFEAMTEKNVEFLDGVLADELTYGHSNGLIESREDHLRNITSGDITYLEMEPLEMDVRSFRRSAVITGLLRVKGLYRGKEFDIRLRYTDVYQKQKGRWRLVAWQSVKVE